MKTINLMLQLLLIFLSTIKDNKSYFSNNEIEGANNARKVQQIIGCPSTSNFKSIIKKQRINNCNVTINGINRAKLIYGLETSLLQGKMTIYQRKAENIKRIPLSLPISEHHKFVQLYIN